MAQEEPLADVLLHGGAVPPTGLAWLELGTMFGKVKSSEKPQQRGKQRGKETDVNQEPPLVHL